jgi:hypothetical protein
VPRDACPSTLKTTPIYLHIHNPAHSVCMHANAEIPPPPQRESERDPRIPRECEREREGERERDRMVDFSQGSDGEE